MELSLIVPIKNEKQNIIPLYQAVKEALKNIDYELIFVDDGSTDETIDEIRKIKSKRIKLLVLRKNYGQSTAMTAGIDGAEGKYIALIDGDLQNDPSDIPMMLDKLVKEDWDVVAGNRKNRKDGALLRKIPSKIANAIIRSTTNVHILDYGCTLKIFKQEIAKDLGLYGELHRFIPVLAALQGAKITQVDVKHHARQFGESKYGINRTFKVMADLITMLFFRKYMQKPMHLFGGIGFTLFSMGVIINIYLLTLKLLGEDIWGKPLMILGIILLLAGLQFITFGLLSEVNMRTYYESQGKKPYQIRQTYQSTYDE
ncbi:glycosyltransferase family 2 protein [Pedobacter cryophilus]|uniref:Glycosyltransferase family 2 protein n=1 Tax=Pedobacter cryophilus TaxID=2571271 RepID=A0A4U1BVC1_9SPHI|nr:glycosyltransferase family 2 protein [Pedobacter cryophilus]TKB96295.1 glycosyltransferase family 2 protein [Pedobacter cryophilus]